MRALAMAFTLPPSITLLERGVGTASGKMLDTRSNVVDVSLYVARKVVPGTISPCS